MALEELVGSIKVIHANGGFAQAPFWVQLLADVFNQRVVVPEEGVQDAAKGAYIVVLNALGEIPGFEVAGDRTSVVQGKSVSVRVKLGGRMPIIKQSRQKKYR